MSLWWMLWCQVYSSSQLMYKNWFPFESPPHTLEIKRALRHLAKCPLIKCNFSGLVMVISVDWNIISVHPINNVTISWEDGSLFRWQNKSDWHLAKCLLTKWPSVNKNVYASWKLCQWIKPRNHASFKECEENLLLKNLCLLLYAQRKSSQPYNT
jgi:hypothetical protein